MKSKITFYIRNFELYNPFNIGNFELKKVTDYDNKIKQLKKEHEAITYKAIAILEGKKIDDYKKDIKDKTEEISQITWLLSFANGIRITPTGWNISPKIDGIPTGNFWSTKPAVFPTTKIIIERELPDFMKQLEPKIKNNNFLREHNLLFPIAFYLSGLEDKMLTNRVILPYISFESLVFYYTEEFIFGKDKLPKSLSSTIEKALKTHKSYPKLTPSRRKELLKKIPELKRRPIIDRIYEFLDGNNLWLSDYKYDIQTILDVRNKIIHRAESINGDLLVKCMKELNSIVVRSILSKLEYIGRYSEITKGWVSINFP